MRRFVPLRLLLLFAIATVALLPAHRTASSPRGVVLEDFESGEVALQSYDAAQDLDPDGWQLTESTTHGGSLYALRLHGNTWKSETIAPYPIAPETVLEVAIYVEDKGETHAFGVGDESEALFYAAAGTEMQSGASWEATYQGAFSNGVWNVYRLPIGKDWFSRYGYLPALTRLIYVNDRDGTSHGVVIFDDVIDVTEDLPIPPAVEIVRGSQSARPLPGGFYRVGIQFHAAVIDPDSGTFTYAWDFGDSSFSAAADPFHNFLIEADHFYTVALLVRDETGMCGRDSLQVRLDPGNPEPAVTMNFVGDVMLARNYEIPGGLIDTYGPEYIFAATRPIYGDAAEVNVCNLECPLTDEGTPHPTKSYVFRGRPSNVAGLVSAGIDVVSLGNNHIIDYGARGLEETQEVLDGAQIRWTGAGADEYRALQPVFWTERGVAIAFLGQCNRTGREYNYQPFLDAAANKPGFAYLTETNLVASIDSVRALADLVVAQLHAGIEYDVDPGTLRGVRLKAGWTEAAAVTAPAPAAAIERYFDAADPVAGMPEFWFRTRPALSDRQLRWRAIEAGADLVICHHPHVLQGFEVYQGVLIAHSLGNFAFDQSFAETFPSVVLRTEFDKNDFRSFTFRPVFIDNMIPRPVSGRLGREILDRMADYSRELSTVVSVDPDASIGTIHLDPQAVTWIAAPIERRVPLTSGGGYYVSPPIEHDGKGAMSRVLEVTGGSGAVEVRAGRELLWHGDFEDEGVTFWNFNSADEGYDGSVAHTGARSLRLRRASSSSSAVSTDLEGYPPTEGGDEYSVFGYLRTENAKDAGFAARIFRDRGSSLTGSYDAGPLVSGTHDWQFLWDDFTVPANAYYFNLRPRLDKPSSGTGYAWFDDLRLVEWEPWQPAALPLDLSFPSNLRFLQVRFTGAADSARVVWEERSAEGAPATVAEGLPGDLGAGGIRLEGARPNPFGERTQIAYTLPRPAMVRLEIFDVSGRRIAVLDAGRRDAGRHIVPWSPRGAASGVYFCHLRAGGETRTSKLILVQ